MANEEQNDLEIIRHDELVGQLRELNKNLSKFFDFMQEKAQSPTPTEVTNEDPLAVRVDNDLAVDGEHFDKLAQAIDLMGKESARAVVKAIQEGLSIKNWPKQVPPPDTQKVKLMELPELKRLLLELAKAKPEVVVNTVKEQLEWPSTPAQAIPVVLVDKDRKKFYNALERIGSIVSAAAGGGYMTALDGDGNPRVLTAVQSAETGEWVLAVANADGSMISGGGAADSASFDFMDDSDFLFMDETGFDFMDA